MRHVDRRHRGCLLRVQPEGLARSPTRSAMRWRPTPVSASAATGCGPGRSAVPAGTQKAEAAQKFVSWATSKDYLDLVASKEGWANVPPGTRTSLYDNPEYQKAAPFAKMTLDSINAADPTKPTVKPVPYVGVQFVAIPEFQGLGTTVGQLFSAALAGQMYGRRRAEAGPGCRHRDDDRRRLHPVRHPPGALAVRFPAGRPLRKSPSPRHYGEKVAGRQMRGSANSRSQCCPSPLPSPRENGERWRQRHAST